MLEEKFLSDLLDYIYHNRLTLPTLPEVALKVRSVVNDPNATAGQIAKVIATDVSLSARLGNVLVRNLVTGMVMEQLHQARTPLLRARLTVLWQHSTQVAAISHVLATYFTTLKPDEALLVG
jgi:HD-like signal output (HDOD) protein